MASSEWIDRVMKVRHGAIPDAGTASCDAIRCYQSETQRFMVELKNGKWAIYSFHEEIENL